MSELPVISEALEALVGRDFPPEVYDIEAGAVKKFAAAIGDVNPAWREVAPPTFLASLVPTGLMHELFNSPSALTRFLNGGNELEYLKPIKIGDKIAVTARLDKLRKMEGKEGVTVFMMVTMDYAGQDGAPVARGKMTFIRY